ncbi:MAG: acyl-CoA dehydrogenase family protein, partial [Acidimicrobiia bacterium]
MDFDLDATQQARLDHLSVLVDSDPRNDDGLPGSCDSALIAAVHADAMLTGEDLTLLDRILLVEHAAKLGARLDPTAQLLIAPIARQGASRPMVGPCAIVVDGADGPVRGGADVTTVVIVSADSVSLADVQGWIPVGSGFGSNYGTFTVGARTAVPWPLTGSPLDIVRLGWAAEIAGAAQAAVEHAAAYLKQRKAFGLPLSTKQALRHRVSELAVDAAGTSVLVRYGAFHNDPVAIASAVSYAAATAAKSP